MRCPCTCLLVGSGWGSSDQSLKICSNDSDILACSVVSWAPELSTCSLHSSECKKLKSPARNARPGTLAARSASDFRRVDLTGIVVAGFTCKQMMRRLDLGPRRYAKATASREIMNSNLVELVEVVGLDADGDPSSGDFGVEAAPMGVGGGFSIQYSEVS